MATTEYSPGWPQSIRQTDSQSIIGNDEIVWEAHDIPMLSLSRVPYPEYHTSDDNPDIIEPDRLQESISVLEGTVEHLENQRVVKKTFDGVPATSHPRYDLYVDTWRASDKTAEALWQVMDHLHIAPKYLPVSDLKDLFDVPREPLLSYLEQWEKSGLLDLL